MTNHTGDGPRDEARDPRDEGAERPEASRADEEARREAAREAEAEREARREWRRERERVRDRQRRERMDERRRRHRDRKERVLHTRISEQLSEDIRRLADDLRVPTSNLVRNVLEEVFTVVESVSDDVGDLLEDVMEEAEGARDRIRRRSRGSRSRTRRRSWADTAEEEIRQDEERESRERERRGPEAARPVFPDVIGWQPLILNNGQACADCGKRLAAGTRAFVGMTEKGFSRTTLCRGCLQDR